MGHDRSDSVSRSATAGNLAKRSVGGLQALDTSMIIMQPITCSIPCLHQQDVGLVVTLTEMTIKCASHAAQMAFPLFHLART